MKYIIEELTKKSIQELIKIKGEFTLAQIYVFYSVCHNFCMFICANLSKNRDLYVSNH